MPTNKLRVSTQARDDLKGIYQYGKANWGVTRAKGYILDLKAKFKYLLRYPEAGVVRDEIMPQIRCLPVKSHIIFYLFNSHQIEVVRILRDRQSAHLHLSRE